LFWLLVLKAAVHDQVDPLLLGLRCWMAMVRSIWQGKTVPLMARNQKSERK
jgi:hypothetical protein